MSISLKLEEPELCAIRNSLTRLRLLQFLFYILYIKTLTMNSWKFQCEIMHICERLICFCRLVLSGNLHDGSCIYLFFNQTKQRKARCITKGTIRLLWFTRRWYKLMQDTHQGKPESSNLRHNQIASPVAAKQNQKLDLKTAFKLLSPWTYSLCTSQV